MQQYCGAPRNAPPPTRGTELRRCVDTRLPTTLQKHAENITIYLQCLNRLNGEDAAVVGQQVLMFDEKRFESTRLIIKQGWKSILEK